MRVKGVFCVKHALAAFINITVLPVCLNLFGVLTGIAACARQSQVQGN